MKKWNLRQVALGVLAIILGIALLVTAGLLSDQTDGAGPGVLLLLGVAIVCVGGALIIKADKAAGVFTRRSSATASQPTAPGWYPARDMAHTLRYWDGEAWTDHVQPMPAVQPKPTSAFTIARGVALGILLVLVILYFLSQNQSSCTGAYC